MPELHPNFNWFESVGSRAHPSGVGLDPIPISIIHELGGSYVFIRFVNISGHSYI